MNKNLPSARHSEAAFETTIEQHLLAQGYDQIISQFDPARALFPDEAIAFVRATQPTEWAKLEALHGEKTATLVLTAVPL